MENVKMNRDELVKAYAEKAGVTQKEAHSILGNVEAVIADAVVDGKKVKFANAEFGSKHVEEKSGVTKLKGEEKAYTTPAHTKGTVRALGALKNAFKA